MARLRFNRRRLPREAWSELLAVWPGLVVVLLVVIWAAHNGGYDADTWYWGALVILALLAFRWCGPSSSPPRLPSRSSRVALVTLSVYVAWSYLSMAWAQSPGDALRGSNRALLYLMVFALMASLRWTPRSAVWALQLFSLATGAIAILILLHMSTESHVATMFVEGRLTSPLGYFNGSVALFTAAGFTALALALRRQAPSLLRGTLLMVACACVQVALLGQSRGWLFTLPAVLLVAVALSPDRLRWVGYGLIVCVAALAPLHRLLAVFGHPSGSALSHAAAQAGRWSLVTCVGLLVGGSLIAAGESGLRSLSLSANRRRWLGGFLAVVVLGIAAGGGVAATHGAPFAFIKRQWNGFSKPTPPGSSGSHFTTVGSGRYDFWRVSMDALSAHPLGGLGQDNFAGYYVTHRHTAEEPSWTHSLEMRLLTHTGLVGFGLFLAFLVAATVAALRVRRRSPSAAIVATAAMIPAVVWIVHGSVDWFWELPALSAPALGFLGLCATMAPDPVPWRRDTGLRRVIRVAGVIPVLGAAVLLGFPYLSVREQSTAADLASRNPLTALRDLKLAAALDPLTAAPARMAGAIALQNGLLNVAEQRFRQAIAREPGGWFSWLGDGLAASALGDSSRARLDFRQAATINGRQPAVRQALARVNTTRPLTPGEAFNLLVVVQ